MKRGRCPRPCEDRGGPLPAREDAVEADEGIKGRRNKEPQATQEAKWRHNEEALALFCRNLQRPQRDFRCYLRETQWVERAAKMGRPTVTEVEPHTLVCAAKKGRATERRSQPALFRFSSCAHSKRESRDVVAARRVEASGETVAGEMGDCE